MVVKSGDESNEESEDESEPAAPKPKKPKAKVQQTKPPDPRSGSMEQKSDRRPNEVNRC
ncbi:hypothetical protein PF010_g6929 [Phytophthora fragariae]|uniref:Uncharacterized protein n=2 Tax=Phytophthora TaxID=4783 RepID=A0A6A3N4E0_9STRA|nr:hypothetical protein PR002_g7719 [Phytophthora rubi]KAE9121937.1 hypothetical protein PF010_g6929 [Phytophthora fragariae]